MIPSFELRALRFVSRDLQTAPALPKAARYAPGADWVAGRSAAAAS
jgi:hypothetical protein